MKVTNLLATVLLATTALLTGHSALATLPIYNAGEIFLGFRTAAGGNDYLVNIGNVAQFASLNPGESITVNTGGNIALDLSSNTGFGSDWFTAGDVLWGVYGGNWDDSTGTNNVLYATKVRLTPEVQSSPWTRRGDTAQSLSVGDLKALAQYYTNSGDPTANSTKGTFQSASNASSWAGYTSKSSDFRLGSSLEGAVGSVLDFYQIDPATSGGQTGTFLGTFTINSGGTVTFTAPTPVPEASTYGVVVAAALGLLVLARRRKFLTANN